MTGMTLRLVPTQAPCQHDGVEIVVVERERPVAIFCPDCEQKWNVNEDGTVVAGGVA